MRVSTGLTKVEVDAVDAAGAAGAAGVAPVEAEVVDGRSVKELAAELVAYFLHLLRM